MPTATKQKSEIADAILRKSVEEDRDFTYDELIELSAMGWDDAEIRRQRRRMNQVCQYQAIAGTAAEREQLQKAADDAMSDLDTIGSKLREQMEAIKKQLDSLEQDARSKERRLEQCNDAVSRLRDLLPDHVAHQYNHQKRAIASSVKRRYLDLKQQVHRLSVLKGLDPSNRNHHDAIVSMGSGFMQYDPASQRWHASPAFEQYRREQLEALPKLQSELATASDEYHKLADENEQLREHYVR